MNNNFCGFDPFAFVQKTNEIFLFFFRKTQKQNQKKKKKEKTRNIQQQVSCVFFPFFSFLFCVFFKKEKFQLC
jgi:hypothetical protein